MAHALALIIGIPFAVVFFWALGNIVIGMKRGKRGGR